LFTVQEVRSPIVNVIFFALIPRLSYCLLDITPMPQDDMHHGAGKYYKAQSIGNREVRLQNSSGRDLQQKSISNTYSEEKWLGF